MIEIRVDRLSLPKISKTKDGYLKGEAIVGRAGVQRYLNADGTERLELRHPNEIFSPSSLETLKTIPVTNDHPNSLVNVDNAKELLIGLTGETVRVDGEAIIANLTITHKDAIDTIQKRNKKELSLGYELELVREEGMYNGERYTHRQTNVKYNHLAIVDKGRAGISRLNFDGVDASVQVVDEINNDNLNNEENNMLETKDNNEAVKAENKDNVIINLDKYVAQIDQLKLENASLKERVNNFDSILADKVAHRISLINKASKVINIDSEDLLKMTDRQIMESAIKASDNNINLDEKSDFYVEGRFDSIVENISDGSAIKSQLDNIVRKDSVYSNNSNVDFSLVLNKQFAKGAGR